MALCKPGSLRPDQAWLLYVGGLLALALYVLSRSPIVADDTDLWYHLAHGRFLFEHGEIPSTSYFSFISPAKVWTDYYWLFQAGVYSIFSAGGYGGLLLWRSLLFAGFLLTVAAFLRAGPRLAGPRLAGPHLICFGGILGFYLIHSFHRFLQVRPHAVSYLFIALFLYVLEVKPAKVFWLPVLAVLWTNFHGIEYPVLLLIAGAYVLEIWIRRFRDQRQDPPVPASRESIKTLIALGLSMAAVFLTPHGAKLVKVPFVSTEYASAYIQEHRQPDWQELFSYRVTPDGPDFLTAFNLLLAMAILGAAGAAWRGRLRLSHLLMLAGGLILLSKAVRLSQECALLALPLIRAFGADAAAVRWPRRSRGIAAALAILALASPVAFLRGLMPDFRELYPLALRNLPHGIASFLNRVDAGGSVMNDPDVGGYLHWQLRPGYRTFMDMEIPFLFADEDLYEIASAFQDPKALHRFIDRYQPDFIAVPLASPDFPTRIAGHPRYVPVFFDDEEVLYVDRRRHPGVARDWALVRIDPFTFTGQRFSDLAAEDRRAVLAELQRISAVDPDLSAVNQATAILYNLDGRYELAVAPARRVIAKNPKLARGHAVLGDALLGLGELDEAIAAYRRAIRRSSEEVERGAIYKSLSLAYFRNDQIHDAYEAWRDGVGRFSVRATFDELFRLGVLAAAAGEPGDARKSFEFALLRLSPEDSELRRQVEENLAALD